MKGLEELLVDYAFFRELEASHLTLLAGCASLVRVEEGDFLFREGEVARAFFVVRHGSVAIQTITPHEGVVTIQTVGEGDLLGWSWLLPPYRWHFSARALQPTVVVGLDAACVRGKCEQDSAFGFDIMRSFAQVIAWRLEAMHLQLMNVYEHRR